MITDVNRSLIQKHFLRKKKDKNNSYGTYFSKNIRSAENYETYRFAFLMFDLSVDI